MIDYSLVIPVLNKPELLTLLLGCLGESDEIPKSLIIVDNGNIKDKVRLVGGKWIWTSINWYNPFENIGVAKSWNYGIKFFQKNSTKFLVVANFDLIFSENSVKSFLEPLQNGYDMVTLERGYCLWGANRSLFEKVGYFDENFYPAYVEDLDFDRRVQLHPEVKKITLALPEIRHEASSTVKGHYNKPLGDALAELKSLNEWYYQRKWGGEHGKETYDLPFRNKPLSYWEPYDEFITFKKSIWSKYIK